MRAFRAVYFDRVDPHFVLESDGEDGLSSALDERACAEFFCGVLAVHSVESVCGDNIAGVDETVECTGRLREVAVVRIVRADAIKDEIEAVGKVGDTGAEAIQIEAVFNI